MKPRLIGVYLWVLFFLYINHFRTTSAAREKKVASTLHQFPQPPANLSFDISVKKPEQGRNGIKKIIEVIILWDPPKSGLPRGYDLSFLPTDSGNKTRYCKQEFTAYHAPNIPPESRSWSIPFESHGNEKKRIHYGCSYEVKLSSFPHPIPKDNYTLHRIIHIPECIDGDCSCQNPLPRVENLRIQTENSTGYLTVSWSYDRKSSIQHFEVTCSERMHLTSGRTMYRKINTILVNFTSEDKYEAVIKLPSQNRYKITVKAFDAHLCNASTDALVECNPNGVCSCVTENLDEPTDIKIISNLSVSSITVLWHYPAANLQLVDHFLVVIAHEGGNVEQLHHVSLPEAQVNVTGLQLINTTLPCYDRKGAISMIKIRAVDLKNCSGPVSKQLSFNCRGVVTVEAVKHNDKQIAIGFVCVGFGLFLLFIIYFLVKYKKKIKYFIIKKFRPQTRRINIDFDLRRSPIYVSYEITEARKKGLADLFEIDSCHLILGEEIGKGAFGRVFKATAYAINGKGDRRIVAVKQLKDDASDVEKEDFLAEIKMMKRAGHHENVVSMLACCTLQQPNCMVMEYVSQGDLLHYLRKLRKEYVKRAGVIQFPCKKQQTSSIPSTFQYSDHRNGSAEYLIRGQSISGDSNSNNAYTATTTITIPEEVEADSPVESHPLITPLNSNYVLLGNSGPSSKTESPDPEACCLDSEELYLFALQISKGMGHLADKGITHRDLAARNVLIDENKKLKISDFGLSRTGVYVTQRSGPVPLRWLSIEAIKDNKYTTKSDVWAFGVVLWEICTLGGFPYATVPDNAFPDYLIRGNRLEKPENCADELYEIMENCWNEDPDCRYSFADLIKILDNNKEQSHVYVNFDVVTNRPLPPIKQDFPILRY